MKRLLPTILFVSKAAASRGSRAANAASPDRLADFREVLRAR
jgi:hypothetical protein